MCGEKQHAEAWQTTEYAYDAIGRLTNLQHVGASGILEAYRYTYDPAQMISNITRGVSGGQATMRFTYDIFGRRVMAIEGGAYRYFVYDGLDVVAELGNNWVLNRNYTRGLGFGGGIGDIVALSSNQGALAEYLSYNHRGDVVMVTTNDGAVSAAGIHGVWQANSVEWGVVESATGIQLEGV
jgi:hypothetical protein